VNRKGHALSMPEVWFVTMRGRIKQTALGLDRRQWCELHADRAARSAFIGRRERASAIGETCSPVAH